MLHGILTSDWHLEALSKQFPSDSVARQLREIDKIYQYALTRGISHIFVPGDITNSYSMTDDTKRQVISHFLRYEGELDTWYIGGNHDRADAKRTSMDFMNDMCKWDFLKSLHVFVQEPEQVEIEGIVVNMLPHPSVKSIKNKKPCLNLVHTDVVGAIGDNGRALKTTKDIQVGDNDFTFGGHIHLHQFLKKKRFLLCGSPYQKNFGESFPKGFVEFKAYYKKKKLIVDWQFVETTPEFRFETVVIKDSAQFSDLIVDSTVRYRLYISEGVILPNDLKIRVPNVDQIHLVKGAVADNIEAKLDLSYVSVSAVDPKEGLQDFMKSYGLSKCERKLGRKLLASALSDIQV